MLNCECYMTCNIKILSDIGCMEKFDNPVSWTFGRWVSKRCLLPSSLLERLEGGDEMYAFLSCLIGTCITNSILYNRGLFDVWYLSFSMCGHFLHASTNQLRQLWFSSLELGISLFNPRKDFLDVFGQSGTMAQRACKATGPFIWSWICHFNLLFSANLDLPLVYELETLVFVTADIEDSIISVSAGLAAVVLCQTLGPLDFFEWKQ